MSADDEKERGFSVKGNNRPGLDRKHGYGDCVTERANKPSTSDKRDEIITKGVYDLLRHAKASRDEVIRGLDSAERLLSANMRKQNRD